MEDNQMDKITKNSEETGQNAEKDTEKTEKWVDEAEKGIRKFQTFVIRLTALIAAAWILFAFIIGFKTVPNADNYPTLHPGDLLVYYRLDRNVAAQDIVVFEKNGTEYVGRVVAVSGETVEITDEETFVLNGKTISEANIFSPTPRFEGFTEYPLTLGDGECFVMADGREGAEDSRYFGPVSRQDIKGTAITVIRRHNL